MYREMVASDGCSIGENIELLVEKGVLFEKEEGKTLPLWREILRKNKVNQPEREIDERDLFVFLHDVYRTAFHEDIDVRFETGFVYSSDFLNSIPHNKRSRVFSTEHRVYLDLLIRSALFEYIANYYLVALKEGKEDVDTEDLMNRQLYYLDHCVRKGNLDSDETKVLLIQDLQHLETHQLHLINDLYWSALAFAMCHELAHIYNHDDFDTNEESPEKIQLTESKADHTAYDIYLRIISGEFDGIPSCFHEVFHDYLYTAPMILFLFYHDLFFVCKKIFGEEIGGNHPESITRINELLRQSESMDYEFNSKDGNAILCSYWECSDIFQNMQMENLINGRLENIKRKGTNTIMKGKGYEEAYLFDKKLCDELNEYAVLKGYSQKKVLGVWNSFFAVEVEDELQRGIVWSTNKKTRTTKGFNIRFQLKEVLIAVIENGLSIALTDELSTTSIVRVVLLILLKALQCTTIELSDDMARVLIFCHNRGAYSKQTGIEEDDLLKQVNTDRQTIDKLMELCCIEIDEGVVYLQEKVIA